MPGDAVSSGFDCISRRFSAGLLGSSARKTVQWTAFSGTSARKTVQWTVFSEDGSADPRRTGRQTPEASQGKSTQKCSSRRRKCIFPNLETHSKIFRDRLTHSCVSRGKSVQLISYHIKATVSTPSRPTHELQMWLECVSKMPEAQFRRLCLHFCVDFP